MAIKKIAKFNVDDIKIKENTLTEHLLSDSNCLDDRYYTETEIDNKLNSKSDTSHTHDYLPLSGGILTNTFHMEMKGNDGYMEIRSAEKWNEGAHICLSGVNNSGDGRFSMKTAQNGSSGHIGVLAGYRDGTLTWNANDLGNSAIVAKSIGSNGYIKYASGLIVQWGQSNGGNTTETITFNVSFSKVPRIVITPVSGTDTNTAIVTTTIQTFNNNNFSILKSNNYSFFWMAIGC